MNSMKRLRVGLSGLGLVIAITATSACQKQVATDTAEDVGVAGQAKATEARALNVNPFTSEMHEVREAYCRYAVPYVSDHAANLRLSKHEGGERSTMTQPAVILAFDDQGRARSIRCEFIQPEMVRNLTRISGIALDGQYVPDKRIDTVNVALVNEERKYK